MHPKPYTHCQRLRPASGFTLVEILVVGVLLTMLAALLFSVISGAREAGRGVVCASNLQQIGLAMRLYASDYSSYYPTPPILPSPAGHRCSWAITIESYVKNSAILECPTAEAMKIGGEYYEAEYHSGCPAPEVSEDGDERVEQRYWGSYDINALGEPSPYDRVRASRFKNPEATAIVLDGHGIAGVRGQWTWTTDGKTRTMYGLPRHRNGANVLFVDGHVRWLSDDALHAKPARWTLAGAN